MLESDYMGLGRLSLVMSPRVVNISFVIDGIEVISVNGKQGQINTHSPYSTPRLV